MISLTRSDAEKYAKSLIQSSLELLKTLKTENILIDQEDFTAVIELQNEKREKMVFMEDYISIGKYANYLSDNEKKQIKDLSKKIQEMFDISNKKIGKMMYIADIVISSINKSIKDKVTSKGVYKVTKIEDKNAKFGNESFIIHRNA